MIIYESEVIGRVITNITIIDGELNFKLDGGWDFYLFNEVNFLGCDRANIQNMIGKYIINISESENDIIFNIQGGISIMMSMLDGAYNGPESMNVWAPDGRVFVSQ